MSDSCEVQVRAFAASDIPAARALWERSEGVDLNESDGEEALARFLARNPGFGAVAVDAAGALVGALVCGHDGRRGYLHHLAVDRAQRRRGIAHALVSFCLSRLVEERIPKCNLFVYPDNREGIAFWLHEGWSEVMWRPLQRRVPLAEEKG